MSRRGAGVVVDRGREVDASRSSARCGQRGEGDGKRDAGRVQGADHSPGKAVWIESMGFTAPHPRFAHLLPASGEKGNNSHARVCCPSPRLRGEGARRPGEGRPRATVMAKDYTSCGKATARRPP